MMHKLLWCALICVLLIVGCGQDEVIPTVERVGEEETAVSHYLNLIQQAPDSPWSWLAWARLGPVESEGD